MQSDINTLKSRLWATANKLRANMVAAKYKQLVLGMIFVKFISECVLEPARRIAPPLRRPD